MTKGKGSDELESSVMKRIIAFLEENGHYWLRMNCGKSKAKGYYIRLSPAGTPDIIAVIDGFAVGLEVKKNDKEKEAWITKIKMFRKTSYVNGYNEREVGQYKAMERIRKSGGSGFLVSSVDEVEEIIKKRRADLNYRDNYLSTV